LNRGGGRLFFFLSRVFVPFTFVSLFQIKKSIEKNIRSMIKSDVPGQNI